MTSNSHDKKFLPRLILSSVLILSLVYIIVALVTTSPLNAEPYVLMLFFIAVALFTTCLLMIRQAFVFSRTSDLVKKFIQRSMLVAPVVFIWSIHLLRGLSLLDVILVAVFLSIVWLYTSLSFGRN